MGYGAAFGVQAKDKVKKEAEDVKKKIKNLLGGKGHKVTQEIEIHPYIKMKKPHETTGEPYEVMLGRGRATMTTGVEVTSSGLHGRMLRFDSLGGLHGHVADPVLSLRFDATEVRLPGHARTRSSQVRH